MAFIKNQKTKESFATLQTITKLLTFIGTTNLIIGRGTHIRNTELEKIQLETYSTVLLALTRQLCYKI